MLNPTRLVWDGHAGAGTASHDGVTVALREAPPVGIDHLRALEYSPCVRIFECRQSANARRDMTPDERDRCAAFLDRLARAARATVEL